MGASKTRQPGQSEDVMGFDESNPSKSWDDISNRAEHYREKLKSMDFNASPVDEETEVGQVKKESSQKPKETAPATPLGALKQMQRQRDDIIGDTTIEAFDPREA